MPAPIEILRELLVRLAPSGESVTDRPTTFFFDEDSAAASDIAVGSQPIRLVVLASRSSDLNEFRARIWKGHCDEVWILDADTHSITVYRPGAAPRIASAGAVLVPATLPGISVPLAAIFSGGGGAGSTAPG